MVTVDKLVIKIGADVKSAMTGISKVERATKRMDETVGKSAASIRRTTKTITKSFALVGAAAAAMGAVVGGVLLKSAAEEEAVSRLTEGLLKSQGESWEELGDTIDKHLKKMEALTAFNDTDLQKSFNSLLTMGMDYESALEAMTSVTDLAFSKNMDLEASAKLIGKAFVGETGELKRYGIVLDESLTPAEKYAGLTEFIATKLTSASAQTDTFTGKLKQVRNELLNIGEAEMDKLLDPMAESVQGILDRLPEFEARVKAAFAAIKQIISDLSPTFDNLKSVFGSVVGILGDLKTALFGTEGGTQKFTDAINTLTGALASVFAWIDEHPTITKLAATIGIAAAAFAFIVPVVTAVGSVIGTIIGAVASLQLVFLSTTTTIGFISGALALLGGPITLLIGAIALLGAAWATNMFGIRDKTSAAFDWIKGAFVGLMNILGNAMTAYINFYIKSFNKLIPLLQKIFPEMEKVAEVSFNNIEKTTLDKTEKVKDSIKSVADTTAETATEIDNSAEKIKQTFDDVATAALSFDEAVEASRQRGLADMSPEQAENRFGTISPNALSAIGGAATGAQAIGQADAGIANVGAGIAQASTLASAGTGRDMEEVENILRESKVTHDASLETQREAGTKLEAVNIGIGAGVEATRAIATAVATLATEIKSMPRGGGGFGDGGNASGSI
ncbi:MAG: hypothetical protein KAJ03_11815 [Gammaproteobacteria bacterium]|nr:hypothetical protein [Gammaproteobacteria bacterium]